MNTPFEYYQEIQQAGKFKIYFETVRDCNGENICRLHDAKIARLFAAAPELLEALEALYEHTKNNHCICGLNFKAKTVIAKAEGKP